MNTDPRRAVLVIVTGVFIAVALLGTPTVLFWATVWVKSNNYRIAAFQVQDTSLSNPQRRFKRFWILNGFVEGRSERVVVPLNDSGHQPPFVAGDLLQVRYNPDGATAVIAGRSLRAITLDEYSVVGRNLAVSAAGFFGPVVAVGLLWFVRRLRRGSSNAADKYRRAIQVCVILVAVACSGCGRAQVPESGGLESLSEDLKVLYERGDTNALVAQVSTNGVPPVLLEAMKQSLLLPVSLGKVEVHSSRVFPFSEHKPTTGVPGVYEGKKLRWAVMPTHWLVLETSLEPPPQADGGRLSTNIKLEFAIAEISGRWRIIGPAYDE